jgi:hypothetical protein
MSSPSCTWAKPYVRNQSDIALIIAGGAGSRGRAHRSRKGS